MTEKSANPRWRKAAKRRKLAHWMMLKQALLVLIRIYQLTLSQLLGPCCRFVPSCSRYAATCIEHHGVLRGCWLALRRLLRCHPFHPGGYDPPPLPGAPPAQRSVGHAADAPCCAGERCTAVRAPALTLGAGEPQAELSARR